MRAPVMGSPTLIVTVKLRSDITPLADEMTALSSSVSGSFALTVPAMRGKSIMVKVRSRYFSIFSRVLEWV